jgi:hypothetical protein
MFVAKTLAEKIFLYKCYRFERCEGLKVGLQMSLGFRNGRAGKSLGRSENRRLEIFHART